MITTADQKTNEAVSLLRTAEVTIKTPHHQPPHDPPLNGAEKILRYTADVRAGEGSNVILLMVNVFLLLFAYYLLKTVREALILTEGTAYIKAYSSAGQAALLMVLVPLYGYAA